VKNWRNKLFELNISVKIPPVNEQKITRAFKDYRQDCAKKSQDLLIDFVQRELTMRNMRVFEDLYESFHPVDLEETVDISRVAVGSDDVAARVAEYGADDAAGGFVNVAEILAWVKQKPVVPTYGTQEQFAFAIARKIGREGQPLHGGLKRPLHNAQRKAQRRVNKIWEDGLPQLLIDLEQR
jgi:hypothetical protein